MDSFSQSGFVEIDQVHLLYKMDGFKRVFWVKVDSALIGSRLLDIFVEMQVAPDTFESVFSGRTLFGSTKENQHGYWNRSWLKLGHKRLLWLPNFEKVLDPIIQGSVQRLMVAQSLVTHDEVVVQEWYQAQWMANQAWPVVSQTRAFGNKKLV